MYTEVHVARSKTSDGSPTTRRSGNQSEYAYKRLKERILDGDLAPGERLVEAHLAEELELSRTPVREALGRLSVEELIARDENGSLIVRVPSPREVNEIYLIREVLDGLAARLAAERITAPEMIVAETAIDLFREGQDTDDTGAAIGANIAFHDMLYEATGNDRLIRMGQALNDFVRLVSRQPMSTPARRGEIADEHEAVVAAVRDRDGDLAERLMREHVTRAREATLRGIAAGRFAAPKNGG
jgi:DNA-binding GntR family transcriptional regulator